MTDHSLPKDTKLGDELNSMSEDSVLEFANIPAAQSGIGSGIVFVSTEMGNYGPRVKFMMKAGRDQPSFSVEITTSPKIIANSLPQKILREFGHKVVEWVALNYDALYDFWYNGSILMIDEVFQFTENLKSLTGEAAKK